MHSRRTLTVSLERAKPASRAMNPACMKKTRKAVTSTHTVFSGLMMSFAWWVTSASVPALAWLAKYHAVPFIRPSTARMPSIFPAKSTAHRRRVSLSRRRCSFSFMKQMFTEAVFHRGTAIVSPL